VVHKVKNTVDSSVCVCGLELVLRVVRAHQLQDARVALAAEDLDEHGSISEFG